MFAVSPRVVVIPVVVSMSACPSLSLVPPGGFYSISSSSVQSSTVGLKSQTLSMSSEQSHPVGKSSQSNELLPPQPQPELGTSSLSSSQNEKSPNFFLVEEDLRLLLP